MPFYRRSTYENTLYEQLGHQLKRLIYDNGLRLNTVHRALQDEGHKLSSAHLSRFVNGKLHLGVYIGWDTIGMLYYYTNRLIEAKQRLQRQKAEYAALEDSIYSDRMPSDEAA